MMYALGRKENVEEDFLLELVCSELARYACVVTIVMDEEIFCVKL
jgi:hypothetical protein